MAVGSGLLLGCAARAGPSLPVLVLGAGAWLLILSLSQLFSTLALQVGTSVSPISAAVLLGVLGTAVAAVGLGEPVDLVLAFPLWVAACVAACAANDASQNYRILQLNGYRIRDGFPAQLLGLMCGVIAAPVALSMVPSPTQDLGSEPVRFPVAHAFAAGFEEVTAGEGHPWLTLGCGALLGLLALGVARVAGRRGAILGALAFATGLYLPAYLSTGLFLGALLRSFAARGAEARTGPGILAASGLIAGCIAAELLFGILDVFVSDRLRTLAEDVPSWAGAGGSGQLLAIVLWGGMGLLLFLHSRVRQGSG